MTRTRLMVDSADFRKVPRGTFKYAMFYVNGKYVTPSVFHNEFQRVIHISVSPDPKWARYAKVLDVETHDASPADAPAFVQARHDFRPYVPPIIYCNRSNFAAVARAMNQHSPHLPWDCLLATLDGTVLEEYEGKRLWGCQFKDFGPGDYDVTEVFGSL